MIKKVYPWILIDKTNMSRLNKEFKRAENLCFAMMKSGAMKYRDFSEFIIIKNESKIIDLKKEMEGVGGDIVSIHNKVKNILENA